VLSADFALLFRREMDLTSDEQVFSGGQPSQYIAKEKRRVLTSGVALRLTEDGSDRTRRHEESD
jgi:hypothetical protein